MGGKFRVKAEGGGQLEAPPVLRRNGRRINEPLRFSRPKEAFQIVQNSFYLADRL
jgi:hypothetical protein